MQEKQFNTNTEREKMALWPINQNAKPFCTCLSHFAQQNKLNFCDLIFADSLILKFRYFLHKVQEKSRQMVYDFIEQWTFPCYIIRSFNCNFSFEHGNILQIENVPLERHPFRSCYIIDGSV